jgi:toprim domain protein
MTLTIIVEGKNDRSRLRRLLSDEVTILCTFGTPGTDTLEKLRKTARDSDVFIFTDNDASGKKIRGKLRDTFPDAEHIYTRKEYAGVEGTPDEYLIEQLEKAELDAYIRYPQISAAPEKDLSGR